MNIRTRIERLLDEAKAADSKVTTAEAILLLALAIIESSNG